MIETSGAGTPPTEGRISRAIAERLENDCEVLRERWLHSAPVRHFVVDDLLSDDLAREIVAEVPDTRTLSRRSSLRERKNVGIALEDYAPIIAEGCWPSKNPECCTP